MKGLNGKQQTHFGRTCQVQTPHNISFSTFNPVYQKRRGCPNRFNFDSNENKHCFWNEHCLCTEPLTHIKIPTNEFCFHLVSFVLFYVFSLEAKLCLPSLWLTQSLFQKQLMSPFQGFMHNSYAQSNTAGICIKLTNIFNSSERCLGFSNWYLFGSRTARDFRARYLFI